MRTELLSLSILLVLITSLTIIACSQESNYTSDVMGGADTEENISDSGNYDVGVFASRLTRYPYTTYRGSGSFAVFWETDREEPGYIEIQGQIFKISPTKLTISVGAEQRRRTVYQYKAQFDNLPEGKNYKYTILSLKTPFEGGFYTVSDNNDFTFAVYGDNRSGAPFMSENPTHRAITSTISKYNPEFVISTGDIVYTGGLESEWYLFFNDGATLFRNTSLFVAIGNHEKGGEEIFKRQFSFTNGDEFYYSFDWGNSHFIILCNICGITPETEQYQWFKRDLETADSNKNIMHIFVAFHYPPYTFSAHSPDSDSRNYIVPLLKQTRVRVVFNGHNHLYEHIYKDGIHYIVSGGGGAPLYPEGEIKYEDGEPPYMVFNKMVFNFSIVRVSGDSINI